MNSVLKKEIEDISALYDLMEDSLKNLKDKILQEYIPHCSKNGQVEEIQKALQVLKQVESHMNELIKLRNSYVQVFGSYIHSNNEEGNEEIEEENEKDIQDVVDRTTWKRENENIRVETIRPDGSSSYHNIIPVHIFEEIVKTIIDQFGRSNDIKTSTISSLLNDKITHETKYKKSPKTLVYSVIKVLIKEGILENKENYKRVYVLKKSPEYISEWLKNI